MTLLLREHLIMEAQTEILEQSVVSDVVGTLATWTMKRTRSSWPASSARTSA